MPRMGERNHNWRGGRTVTEHGYVLLRVGIEHPLADVRGYAYEHRIVAQNILERPLQPEEIVHHKDGDRQNNSPDNLLVVMGNSGYLFHHRERQDTRKPGEENALISCECGCGARFPKYDSSGRPRRFVSGHNTIAARRKRGEE